MSWQTVLKVELLPPKKKVKTKLTHTKGDMDQCCDDAFESFNIWLNQNGFAITSTREPDIHINDIRDIIKSCSQLKLMIRRGIKQVGTRQKDDEAFSELKQIWQTWQNCEEGDTWRKDLI